MVSAIQTTLQELLGGPKQYQVPLYQRTYAWTEKNTGRLWDDLLLLVQDLAEDPHATHFIGSVVLAPSPANGPAGVSEFLVVDGQQRMTTLTLLLAAIRDHRQELEGGTHFDRITESFLVNKYAVTAHRLKLLPTQADRDSYLACIEATPGDVAGGRNSATSRDGIVETYRYFRKKLAAPAPDGEPSLDVAALEQAITSGLAVVSVTALTGDNAHRIFESLNNTGEPLTQGDLLRNYLFMRLPNHGETVYRDLWLPLQSALTATELETLFWLDLVQDEPTAKQSDTYSRQQKRLSRLASEDDIRAEVARFARLGALLRAILHPQEEPDPAVRARLRRLKQWGTTTAWPLLLHLMERRRSGTATSEDIAQAMLIMESFFVRRMLIGAATNNLNRILLQAVSVIADEDDVTTALHRYLSVGRRFYATDRAVADALTRIPFYVMGRAPQRKLVLSWLEESYASREPVDLTELTIEHVMPQTPTAAWRAELAPDLEDGETFDDVHTALHHTLGNLTLTGYNSTLSNSPFETKRTHLASSGLKMNQEIAAAPRWGRAAIAERAARLAERIISLWPGPMDGAQAADPGPEWARLTAAVAALPAGRWTTYGDLAALIGSHPVPVGVRIATHPIANAHRVLQVEGTISPGFRWYEPDRSEDPREVLAAEGVEFDSRGRASTAQRFGVDALADLLGADVGDQRAPVLSPGQDRRLRDSFLRQLQERVGKDEAAAALALASSWMNLGGDLQYGTATETSCALMLRPDTPEAIWPVALYPSGTVEFVFQYLAVRPPFDDPDVRERYRHFLNTIDGINIGRGQLSGRPSFRLSVLTDHVALQSFVTILRLFITEAQPQ